MTHIERTIYRTEDGRTFDNEFDAVTHDIVLQYNKHGEFGHCGFITREKEAES